MGLQQIHFQITTKVKNIIGQKLADRCRIKNINKVIFDKGHYIYHGRVKALAEGARIGGLQF